MSLLKYVSMEPGKGGHGKTGLSVGNICYAVAMERLLNQYHMQADNTTVYAASLSQIRASGTCRLLMTTNKSNFSVSLSPIHRTTCVEAFS